LQKKQLIFNTLIDDLFQDRPIHKHLLKQNQNKWSAEIMAIWYRDVNQYTSLPIQLHVIHLSLWTWHCSLILFAVANNTTMNITASRVIPIFNVHVVSAHKISPSIVLMLKLKREMFHFWLIRVYIHNRIILWLKEAFSFKMENKWFLIKRHALQININYLHVN